MAATPRTTYTVEEYLAFERASDTKHEYYAGEIVTMAGASYAHNLIVGDTSAHLYTQMRGQSRDVLACNQRLSIGPAGPVVYPDIMVVCDQPRFVDGLPDTITNPTVIIEVLSSATEVDDRGRKARHYRTLASLQEYLLIAQDECQVEHYVRAANGWWRFNEVTDPAASIELTSIGCTLALSAIYERVDCLDTTGREQ